MHKFDLTLNLDVIAQGLIIMGFVVGGIADVKQGHKKSAKVGFGCAAILVILTGVLELCLN
ncbi:hypothetical protein CN613_25495 [Bacillus pseudomycoides]|uniref:Uncharacterized protein n=1 Tax=Bacillus pseudomycoides TaxID=64104 RepID=A0A2A8BYF2_9BACI|nr:hypothetical protein [Bacillus pseudomycoides]PEM65301.1 hypothetical protein CN613_25495 [Bacillus pseudomycoides]